MKKLIYIFLCICIVLSLTGCGGKENPSNDELINVFETNELTKDYFINPIQYDENTDTNQILGKPHEYISKFVFDDSRSTESSDDYTGGTIEIFNNEQDATIRFDYLQQQYSIQEELCNKEQFWLFGRPILTTMYIHRNGNIVIRINKTLDSKIADEYFNILDDYLGDVKYKQNSTISKSEYDQLYEEKVTGRKNEPQKYFDNNKESYLSQCDNIIKNALDEYEKDLTDEKKESIHDAINNMYKGKFYDSLRKSWNDRFEELNTKKAENEIVYQENVDNINSLIKRALDNPTQSNYDAANDAIYNLESCYYYDNFRSEWNDNLSKVDMKIQEAERDKNVADINSKLNRLESNLSTSLYDEINNFVTSKSSNSLYSDYISEWRSRLKSVESDINEKKHKEEIQEFKNSCKSIGYTEFSRNSESYMYTPVYFKGEVVQVVDQDSSGATLRVNVTYRGYGWYDDTIYVQYDNSDDVNKTKILEDDIIKIWGYGAGDISYKTVLGATLTIPAVYATYIEIQ